MPEIANLFARCGIPFHQVNGALEGDEVCWQEIDEWMDAARVAHILSQTRLGLMGHYYSGMMDIATDLVAVSHVFGVHVEQLEVDELSRLRTEATETTIRHHGAIIRETFDIQEDCSDHEV